LNRNVANIIRHMMDEWIPPAIRDSRWFMWPFFWVAYRGKNIAEVMDFKKLVYGFSPEKYADFYRNLDTISRNRKTDLNAQSLRYILDNVDASARSLIDVGSGNGFLLRKIHERHPGLDLTGFDIAEEDDPRGVYEYVQGDIENMPFPDKSFDVVVSSHTLEHLLKPERCIAELIRIAKRQLFIVTPCQRYYYYTLDEHVNFFPFKEKLTSLIPLQDYWCEKLGGDWAYLGRPDAPSDTEPRDAHGQASPSVVREQR
jgi:ubiquinone/menaquinone biosynthesis C-methylase UbiE